MKTRSWSSFLLTIFVAGLILTSGSMTPKVGARPVETIADLLRAQGLSAPGDASDSPITSYAIHGDSESFLAAYYHRRPGNRLSPPLHLLFHDRKSGRWARARLTDRERRNSDPGWPGWGSVVRLTRAGSRLYAGLHHSPSAETTLVFDTALQRVDTLDGWVVAARNEGEVLYHGSMVHFAAVHPATLHRYDPDRMQSRRLFPCQPRARPYRQWVEELRSLHAARDTAWFSRRNHPMDPTLFSRSIRRVQVDTGGYEVHFEVVFQRADLFPVRRRLHHLQKIGADWTPDRGVTPKLLEALQRDLSTLRARGGLAEFYRLLRGDTTLSSSVHNPADPAFLALSHPTDWRAEYRRREPAWLTHESWVRLFDVVLHPPLNRRAVYVYDRAEPGGTLRCRGFWRDEGPG